VTTDLAGNPRIADGTVDLGAYEFHTAPADTTPPTLSWGDPTPAPNAAGWNNTAVDIAFTTDDDSGVAPTASTSSPLHFASEGAGQAQTVIVTDAAGNSAPFTSPTVNIDLTKPTTSASVSGSTTSTVTLSASDGLSGLKATYYTIDGGAQQTYARPFTVAKGQHTVQYWSVDNADNVETANTLTYGVTVTVANFSGKRGGKVNLSATVAQSSNGAKLSGLSVLFVLDGRTFAGYSTTNKQGVASLSFAIPTNFPTGSHTIQATFPGTNVYNSNYGTGTLTVTR
jgi:hypothetical protein